MPLKSSSNDPQSADGMPILVTDVFYRDIFLGPGAQEIRW